MTTTQIKYKNNKGDNLNWDAVGSVAESVGAFGVIASLIYLAFQVRASTRGL